MGEHAPPPARRTAETATQDPASRQAGQRVWDLPTRLFHWALVTLLATS